MFLSKWRRRIRSEIIVYVTRIFETNPQTSLPISQQRWTFPYLFSFVFFLNTVFLILIISLLLQESSRMELLNWFVALFAFSIFSVPLFLVLLLMNSSAKKSKGFVIFHSIFKRFVFQIFSHLFFSLFFPLIFFSSFG